MYQLRDTELKRFLREFKRPPVRIIGVLQNVEDPANVGSIFRIADAIRVEKLVLTGITPQPNHPLISKIARGKERKVPWEYVKDLENTIKSIRDEGFCIYGLEITDKATLYYREKYSDKVCIVMGHEDYGITKSVLALCDKSVFIPMYGKGRSMNVHVAFGIAIYHIVHSID